jgi:hypothetical protein
MNQKMGNDFGYPRACRFRKTLNENRLNYGSFIYQLFSKLDFYFIKYSQNWPKLTDFQTSLGYFHVFQVVEHIPDILTTNIVKNETFSKKAKKSIFGHFLLILTTFYKVKIMFWRKLVEEGAITYFHLTFF